jgi:phospholipid/cholesterol/gamma-HCH transport system substrate-binding protein
METRANYVLIGLFTLAVVLGAFVFVYWFQGTGGIGPRDAYQVRFEGPVSGLRTGSTVLFNGVRVGEVTQLRISPDDPRHVVADMLVEARTPIRADTVVGLDFQGLTGISSLSLRGGSAGSPPLTGKDGAPPMLVAPSTVSQDVVQAVRDVLGRFDSILSENQTAFGNAVKNVDVFAAALARSSKRFDGILDGLENLSGNKEREGELGLTAKSFREGADAVRDLARNLDKRTDELTTSIRESSESVRDLARNLDKRTDELTAILDKRLEEVTRGITHFADVGAREFQSIGTSARRTLTEVERTVRNIDQNPSRLLFGGSQPQRQQQQRR